MMMLPPKIRRSLAAAFLVAFVAAGGFCHAATNELHFLRRGAPDAATLLSSPPPLDSPEQAADLEAVRHVYAETSSNEMALAYGEKKFSVFNFSEEAGTFFASNNLPRTVAFFAKVQSDASTATDTAKAFFKRSRPYTVDTNLANGKLEKSFGYPSGHATEAMVLALVLAELLPEQREAILAHARQIGWHRVQIARHYPTDIYAGRVFAQAIVGQMKQSREFRKGLGTVKSEIATAQATMNDHPNWKPNALSWQAEPGRR